MQLAPSLLTLPSHTFPRPWSTLAEGSSSGFRYFWITDSCPTADAVCTAGEAPVQPFEVLSLAQPIAAALQI